MRTQVQQGGRHCLPFLGFSLCPASRVHHLRPKAFLHLEEAAPLSSCTHSSLTLPELISLSLSTTNFSPAGLDYLCDPTLPPVCLCFPVLVGAPQTSTEGTFRAGGRGNFI